MTEKQFNIGDHVRIWELGSCFKYTGTIYYIENGVAEIAVDTKAEHVQHTLAQLRHLEKIGEGDE